jgi:hypothetical protein
MVAMANSWVEQLMLQTISEDSAETKVALKTLEDRHLEKQQDLRDRKAQSIALYEKMLMEAQRRKARPSVINAYEALLAQTTAV